MTTDHMVGQGQSMCGFSSWPGSKGLDEHIFNSYTSRDGHEVNLTRFGGERDKFGTSNTNTSHNMTCL